MLQLAPDSQKFLRFSGPVVIAAPTGLAACNIGGTIIHRVLFVIFIYYNLLK